jgi:hypothetical protein
MIKSSASLKYIKMKNLMRNKIRNNSIAWICANVLIIKPKELKQDKTDEYFELDEDIEISKIDIKHQDVITKIISNNN